MARLELRSGGLTRAVGAVYRLVDWLNQVIQRPPNEQDLYILQPQANIYIALGLSRVPFVTTLRRGSALERPREIHLAFDHACTGETIAESAAVFAVVSQPTLRWNDRQHVDNADHIGRVEQENIDVA